MAHFYAEIQGNRGKASRCGSKGSGITGHIRGWHLGVEVMGGLVDDGGDGFDVYATGGSNDAGQRIYLGRVVIRDGEKTFLADIREDNA